MTFVTWTMMAMLQPTHGHLECFDMDLSDVPESSRQAVLIRDMREYHQPEDAVQAFAATMGLAISDDGVRVSDEDAPGRAYAFALLLEDETYGNRVGIGPLARAIGSFRTKQVQKDSSILAQVAELVAIALDPRLRKMPKPDASAMAAMRVRVLGHRPAIAA